MSSHKDINKAVALKYNQQKNSAPVVVASGSGYVASKVVEIAEENGVPVYKDDSLATILSQLEMGSEIPENLYKSIVDIYVYFLKYNKLNDNKQTQSKLSDNSKEEGKENNE